MKYTDVKSAKDFALPGVSIEYETNGSALEAVHFKTGDRSFRIRGTDTYSRNVQVQERLEYETSERYVVKGRMHGVSVLEYYPRMSDADKRHRELRDHGDFEDVVSVKVLVNDKDEVVKVLDE